MKCQFDHRRAQSMARGQGNKRETFVAEDGRKYMACKLPSFCAVHDDGFRPHYDPIWYCTNAATFVVDHEDGEEEFICGYHAKIFNWIEPEFRNLTAAGIAEILGPRAHPITEVKP